MQNGSWNVTHRPPPVGLKVCTYSILLWIYVWREGVELSGASAEIGQAGMIQRSFKFFLEWVCVFPSCLETAVTFVLQGTGRLCPVNSSSMHLGKLPSCASDVWLSPCRVRVRPPDGTTDEGLSTLTFFPRSIHLLVSLTFFFFTIPVMSWAFRYLFGTTSVSPHHQTVACQASFF